MAKSFEEQIEEAAGDAVVEGAQDELKEVGVAYLLVQMVPDIEKNTTRVMVSSNVSTLNEVTLIGYALQEIFGNKRDIIEVINELKTCYEGSPAFRSATKNH